MPGRRALAADPAVPGILLPLAAFPALREIALVGR